MKRAVLFISLLALTAALVSRIIPSQQEQQQSSILSPEERQALLTVGRELAGAAEPVLVSEPFPAPAQPVLLRSAGEDFPLRKMVALNLTGFKLPVAALTHKVADNAAADVAQPAAASDEEPAAEVFSAASPAETEAFMARQAAFSDYALPASVDCAAPALPFESVRPVSAEITSVFGYRLHPVYGDVRFHYGTDFNVCDGTEIAAFASGTVRSAGEISGYGQAVVIDHPEGYSTLYAHCSELKCAAGEAVAAGQVIALSGHSGMVTGPHMHFELQRNGLYLNPEYYI